MLLGHTLVIRPGALGDAILALPALHALRISGAERLTVLGTPASWRFLRPDCELRVCDFASVDWLGLHDPRLPLSANAQAVLAQTRTAVVYLADCGVVERCLRTAGVANVICAPPPTGQSLSPPRGEERGCQGAIGSMIAPCHAPARSSETARCSLAPMHAASLLLKPIEPFVFAETMKAALAIREQKDDPWLKLDAAEISDARARFSLSEDSPLLGLHPGSGGRRKCWPVENFAALAARVRQQDQRPLVFFGPADEELAQRFQTLVPGEAATCIINRPLREVLALLSLCRAFVGNDSGLTHLAARACRTVALFGPTDPAVWSPLGEDVTIVQAPGGKLDRLAPEEVPV